MSKIETITINRRWEFFIVEGTKKRLRLVDKQSWFRFYDWTIDGSGPWGIDNLTSECGLSETEIQQILSILMNGF